MFVVHVLSHRLKVFVSQYCADADRSVSTKKMRLSCIKFTKAGIATCFEKQKKKRDTSVQC